MSADLAWFTSSYSGSDGGECVEVAVEWRTSSYSGSGGGECVEVATCSGAVHVRDSKDRTRPGLTVAPAQWAAFTGFVSDPRVAWRV
ncbi:DUF397 domain-containing protein [Streptomyces sp. A3M-1-3]|uniref:DUF397 domain-containing protein n=1 Tax=Streptomyces sp. A3M-1-3 TaxID=2962044 RepID=UPI0020B8ED58|nr:DUF397 domain-containing protein [Streptomyces sp. A3M-1-3]MCP3822305.1 DUF397 domain-containing protein [Streptomyces sp. A3M-1-3]